MDLPCSLKMVSWMGSIFKHRPVLGPDPIPTGTESISVILSSPTQHLKIILPNLGIYYPNYS